MSEKSQWQSPVEGLVVLVAGLVMGFGLLGLLTVVLWIFEVKK